MKRILVFILVLVCTLSAAACGAGRGNSPAGHGGAGQKGVSDLLQEAGKEDQTAPASAKTGEEDAELKAYLERLKAMDPVPWETPADVDLTQMSATMVYSEVSNMTVSARDYVGKTVKIRGALDVYQTPKRNYYACVIWDATACCPQGIEFVPAGLEYPADFPSNGATITVIGTFDVYEEEGVQYFQLIGAQMKTA